MKIKKTSDEFIPFVKERDGIGKLWTKNRDFLRNKTLSVENEDLFFSTEKYVQKYVKSETSKISVDNKNNLVLIFFPLFWINE